MPVRDYSGYKESKTLTFRVEKLDGELIDLVIPPFDPQTEKAFRKHQIAGLKALKKLVDTDAEGLTDEEIENLPSESETLGQYWAPMLAACIKVPSGITVKFLRESFPGMLLRDIGGDVVHFYMYGKLPTDEDQPELPQE